MKFDEPYQEIADDVWNNYKSDPIITEKNAIPTKLSDYPLEKNEWLKIPDVLSVFIDMKGSTNLNVSKHDKTSAKIYQLFTVMAVKTLNYYGADYIDVKGDGAFGLFNANSFYKGLCAGITFKTFAHEYLKKVKLSDKEDDYVSCHIGMDRKTLLVKRVGLKRVGEETTKQNEVWAGKPVNISAKLAGYGGVNELLISERVFSKIHVDKCENLLISCGCKVKAGVVTEGEKSKAWETHEFAIEETRFDFSKYYKMTTHGWCQKHGSEYRKNILEYDE